MNSKFGTFHGKNLRYYFMNTKAEVLINLIDQANVPLVTFPSSRFIVFGINDVRKIYDTSGLKFSFEK